MEDAQTLEHSCSGTIGGFKNRKFENHSVTEGGGGGGRELIN